MEAEEEDMHGLDINSIYTYLESEDDNHMILMEVHWIILK